MDAVRHCGSSSVPLLLKLLRVRDSSVKLKLLNMAARQNFIRIQGLSADWLMRFEKQTKPALLELLKVKDESVRKRAANLLRMITTADANAAENQ